MRFFCEEKERSKSAGSFAVRGRDILKDGRKVGELSGMDSGELTLMENGVWEWKRILPAGWKTDFSIGIRLFGKVDFYMIPCVNYNGNHWGEGLEPKGLYWEGESWRFAFHRSGVPAGMYAQNRCLSVGLFGCADNPAGFSACIRPEDEGVSLTLLFPEQEGPRIYCARDRYEERAWKAAWPDEGKDIVLRAWFVLTRRKDSYDYGPFLNAAWRYGGQKAPEEKHGMCGQAARPDIPDQDNGKAIWERGITFLKESCFFRQDGFTGFCMGLTWNGERWEQKRDYLEIGWVGQNASLAVSLLYEYAYRGDRRALEMGLAVLDCWAEGAALPNGMFRCRFDRILEFGANTGNRTERNDAANLYSVVAEYLEAWRILDRLSIKRDNYRRLALAVCDFAVCAQGEDGRLAKAWYDDGTVSDPGGTIGCYLAEALCIGYEETGKNRYLDAAERAFSYYYREFAKYGYTTAGALDTCCVDKESAIPLLRTALLLQRLRGGGYLDRAVEISRYLATWQYHYDVPYGKDTLLGKFGYGTRGGTAVSVQHHHLDCYGLEFYEAWKELAVLTGDCVWAERAGAIWKNSLQFISDGTLAIKGQRRPEGSQDEGVLQTRWHTKKGDYFGVSEWLVTWNTAFRLKILRKTLGLGNEEDFKAKRRENDKPAEKI